MTADNSVKANTDEQLSAVAKLQADLKNMPRAPKRILGNKLTVASYSRPDFRVIVDDMNTTVEDVIRPDYWANCGDKLAATIAQHPFARIEVIWADGSRFLDLIVIDAGQLYAKCKVLNNIDLTVAESGEVEPVVPEFIVKHVSPTMGWCVVRVSNNERIKEKLGSKINAERELADFLKMLKS